MAGSTIRVSSVLGTSPPTMGAAIGFIACVAVPVPKIDDADEGSNRQGSEWTLVVRLDEQPVVFSL